jgi:hypothetical protein
LSASSGFAYAFMPSPSIGNFSVGYLFHSKYALIARLYFFYSLCLPGPLARDFIQSFRHLVLVPLSLKAIARYVDLKRSCVVFVEPFEPIGKGMIGDEDVGIGLV